MPKIELSFDEMITLAAACQQTAESLEYFQDLAAEYKAMLDTIHERFAAAETQERFEERCRDSGALQRDRLMSAYIILYTDAGSQEKQQRFDGSHKALLEYVNKLQAGQPAGAPPVLWSKL